MIRQDLLDFQYYLNNLSMFMRESYGIQEHLFIYYKLLDEVNNEFNKFFNSLNIKEFEPILGQDNSILDKIGAIFNCYRSFTINYIDEHNTTQTEYITLTDEEFIVYIKCQIVKQNFQGTNEELLNLYSTDENNLFSTGLILYYHINQDVSGDYARATIYFENASNFSQSIQHLFLGGYLTIESMGINYTRSLSQSSDAGRYAEIGDSGTIYEYDGGRYI